eukprot:5624962-Prymnesium_polylepis.1
MIDHVSRANNVLLRPAYAEQSRIHAQRKGRASSPRSHRRHRAGRGQARSKPQTDATARQTAAGQTLTRTCTKEPDRSSGGCSFARAEAITRHRTHPSPSHAPERPPVSCPQSRLVHRTPHAIILCRPPTTRSPCPLTPPCPRPSPPRVRAPPPHGT